MWQSKKLSIMKREYTEIRESVKNNMEKNQREILAERFEFRQILPQEADQAVEMEQICFPPHEACTEEHMKDRIEKAPSLFLVAMDRETGKLAGLLRDFPQTRTPSGMNFSWMRICMSRREKM